MKWLTMVIVVWLCTVSIQAQQIIERHFNYSAKEAVKLIIQIADSVNIHTWEKSEVYIKASVNVNDNKDNAAYVTSFDEAGKSVVVNAKFKDDYFKGKKNCCNQTAIFWQVYLPANALFSVESINANITIRGETGEMKVKTISGFIDLSAKAGRNADIDFSTISGRIYSDQTLVSEKRTTALPVKIMGKLNSGGTLIKLETISGDIFFRKSE